MIRSGAKNDGLRLDKPSQDTAEDAGDLAALMREREENQVLMKTRDIRDGTKGVFNRFQYSNPNRKVIRKKIIKTHPDGKQTISFQFVINCDDETLSKISETSGRKKNTAFMGNKKKAKQSLVPMRESMFEEDITAIKVVPLKRKAVRSRGRRSSSDPDYVATPARSSSQPKGKKKTEKKRVKRKREDDDEDLYVRTLPRGSSNRQARGSARELKPHAKIAEALENIRVSCEKRPTSGPFHRPVDITHFPTYFEVIANPIDLQTIRDKIKRYEYRTADAFIKDFELMRHNAIKFNGMGHHISQEATKIYEFVKSTIDANRDEFNAMEIAVEEQFNSNSKRARSATPKQTDTVANSASVVNIEGVAQRIYLGDLQDPSFKF